MEQFWLKVSVDFRGK